MTDWLTEDGPVPGYDDDGNAIDVAEETLTFEDFRDFCDQLSDHIGEWQGIPVPLGDELPLVLCKDHPLREQYTALGYTGQTEIEIIVDDRYDEHGGLRPDTGDVLADIGAVVADQHAEERLVNSWFCRKRNVQVYVYHRAGKAFAVTVPRSPDRSMDRLMYWLTTIGGSDAWDLDAECAAMDTLSKMLSARQMRHYCLTGSFMETSKRSGITYVFRRCRPTIALTSTWRRLGPDSKPGPDSMRCLAVLCLHPIGYYAKSWAGCMVPSDDVIAHLTFMRGDEAGLWGQANQHALSSPEAGL